MDMKIIIVCVLIILGLIFTGFHVNDAAAESAPKVSGQEKGEKGVQGDKFSFKVERFRYTAGGRRDPFVSIISIAKKKMEVRVKSKNPLENFDVTDFKLLGVIYDGMDYYASVVLPDQKAYTLQKGMKVGIYGGKVDNITSDRLVVKEFVADVFGKLQPKYTEIKLRKEEAK